MGHKISKEQIDPGVKDHIMSFVGNINELETDEKSNIIDAVNSLIVDRVDNAENMGKLANAIGEPITANHSVNEVVEGLGEMLSTFKTNMMNNGVVVESGDKFKSLIDKIATMAGEGSGKGIQYAKGSFSNSSTGSEISALKIQHNLGCVPELVFVTFTKLHDGYNGTLQNVVATNLNIVRVPNGGSGSFSMHVYDLNKSEFTISISNNVMASGQSNWYAIGVGEEDTTLRDSLANILENKGVDVTEEDDMASLIGKVDGIESGGLDIISATELPSTGRENQICVITDNPVDNYSMTSNSNDVDTTNNELITLLTIGGNKVSIINNNLINNYYFGKVHQGQSCLASYIFQNNVWTQLTKKEIIILQNGVYMNTTFHGKIVTGDAAVKYTANKGLVTTTDTIHSACFKNRIDFSLYNTIKFKAYGTTSTASITFFACDSQWNNAAMDLTSMAKGTWSDVTIKSAGSASNVTEIEYDISGITGNYYLMFRTKTTATNNPITISDLIIY